MKRLCTLLLALASVLTVSASKDKVVINGLLYLLDSEPDQYYDLPATVTWSQNDPRYDNYPYLTIDIPSYVMFEKNQYKVSAIGWEAFKKSPNLHTVTIPSTVRPIGDRAFAYCPALKHVYMSTVDSMGLQVFLGCTSLDTIHIESYMYGIKFGKRTFEDCSSLKYVTFNPSIHYLPDSMLLNCTGLESFAFTTDIWSIGEGFFAGCSSLKQVDFGQSILEIPNYTFANCTSLDSIVLSNKIKKVGQWAFTGCSSLKYIDFGIGVYELANYALAGMTGLESIVLPKNIFTIGDGLFRGNTSLRSVTWGENIHSIPLLTFADCTALDSVDLPAQITEIQSWAFMNCTSLKSVTIPENVTSVQGGAFYGCSALKEVTVNSPAAIANSPYKAYNAIHEKFGQQVTHYILGDNFTSVPDSLFAGCTNLQKVTLSPNITSIGNGAFANCTGLDTIVIPAEIKQIAANAFAGCTNLKTVVINSSAIFNQTFTESRSLKDIFGEQVTTYVLGDSITTIGGYTFAGCANLTNVIIGKNVKTIQNYAFRNWTGCTSITIPEQIETIGGYVFYGCTNLRTVYWNAINCREQYTSNYMFQGIATQIDTIYLGENVEYITETLFAGMTQLTSFTLPAHIKGIRDNAFKDCTFTKVYISDLSAWCQLELGHNPLDIADELYVNGQLLEGEFTLPSNITTVGYRVFDGYQHITSLIIPDNITTINYYAFRGTPLRSVTVGSGVVDMNYACYQCDSLTTVYLNAPSFKTSCSYAFGPQVTDYILSENITVIGAGWFRDCTNMRAITIPENVTAIETSAFSGCTGLKEIVVPDRVTSIGSYAFSDCHLNKITLGESIDSIADGAFMYCGIDTVVWNIRNYRDCVKDDTPFKQNVMRPVIGPIKWDITGGITSFIFGDKVEYVPAYLCQNMYQLTSLIFPKGVTSIGENAFYGCNAVTFIDLPSTLTSIGAGTFGSCGQLDTLYCHAKTPPVITDNTFNNYTTYNCKVFVQKSSLAQYKSATGWKNFTNYITIPDEDQGIEEVIANGKLADKQKVLIDGQLYILRGEKIYTMQGQEVK